MDNAIETFLDKSPFFAELTAEEKDIVEEHMYEMHLDPGEELFKEGDPGDFVCFIVSGTLQVLKTSDSGELIELAVLESGQSLGEMGIIEQTHRFATVRALEESVLMVLTRKGFDLLLSQHPRIGVTMLKTLARLMSIKIRELSNDFMDFFRK